MLPVIRWLVWSLYVVVWTIALEVPVVAPEGLPGREVILTYRMFFAKSAHVAAYVVLTVLSAWVPLPGRYRPVMMFFLMAHAAASEMAQIYLEPYCHRGGSVADVGLDHLGIAIGLAVSWKWWTRAEV